MPHATTNRKCRSLTFITALAPAYYPLGGFLASAHEGPLLSNTAVDKMVLQTPLSPLPEFLSAVAVNQVMR